MQANASFARAITSRQSNTSLAWTTSADFESAVSHVCGPHSPIRAATMHHLNKLDDSFRIFFEVPASQVNPRPHQSSDFFSDRADRRS
jgi:hypothetical protein